MANKIVSLVVDVDYEEFKPETYRGVIVRAWSFAGDVDDGIVMHRETTGIFNTDLRRAKAWAHAHANGASVSIGSDVENYLTDAGVPFKQPYDA